MGTRDSRFRPAEISGRETPAESQLGVTTVGRAPREQKTGYQAVTSVLPGGELLSSSPIKIHERPRGAFTS